MREIKFRAWDTKNKVMEGPESWLLITQTGRVYMSGLMRGPTLAPEGLYVLMQFIGLTDKNGKEIYEGDIVENNGFTKVVKYGIQEVDAFECMGFNLSSFMEENKPDGKKLSRTFQVIGNMYENPELLEDTLEDF